MSDKWFIEKSTRDVFSYVYTWRWRGGNGGNWYPESREESFQERVPNCFHHGILVRDAIGR